MQVALFTNRSWLDEELASLRYLVVGFLDELVSVVQVVPQALPIEDAIQFGTTITWRESSWGWIRRQRLLALEQDLVDANVSVLHGLHCDMWDSVLRLGANMDCPVVLNVSSYTNVIYLRKLNKLMSHARVALTASTEPLADVLMSEYEDSAAVATIRSGVHLAELDDHPRPAGRPVCAVICGNHISDEDYRTLFAAICKVVTDHPETQFFLDAGVSDTHSIWQLAKSFNLLTNMSMTPHRLGHREIELAADVIIHPQATGMSRSMTLQAMAHAVPVLAKEDKWVDYLIQDETAWLAKHGNADEWEVLLRRIIEEPEASKELGMKARMWVGKDHLASKQVADTLNLYRQITGEEMKFPTS